MLERDNNFTTMRTHISHFRRMLIEDRCTSRGGALYGIDEGTERQKERKVQRAPPSKIQ